MCNAMHEYSNTYLRAFYRTLVSRLKTALKDKTNTSSFQELSIACLKDEMTMTELVTLITAKSVRFLQIQYVTQQILLNADRQG